MWGRFFSFSVCGFTGYADLLLNQFAEIYNLLVQPQLEPRLGYIFQKSVKAFMNETLVRSFIFFLLILDMLHKNKVYVYKMQELKAVAAAMGAGCSEWSQIFVHV